MLKKFTPGAERSFNVAAGKAVYTNSKTGVQIVHDIPSDYFRIFDKSGKALDLKGNVATGTNAEVQANSHFLNADGNSLPIFK